MTPSAYPTLTVVGTYHEDCQPKKADRRSCQGYCCMRTTTAFVVLSIPNGLTHDGIETQDHVVVPLCRTCAEARGLKPCGCAAHRARRAGRLVMADPALRPDIAEAAAGVVA